jgi:hypothetical protein
MDAWVPITAASLAGLPWEARDHTKSCALAQAAFGAAPCDGVEWVFESWWI